VVSTETVFSLDPIKETGAIAVADPAP